MKIFKSIFIASILCASFTNALSQPSASDQASLQVAMSAVKDAEARKDWSEIRRIADNFLEKNSRNPQGLYLKGYSQFNLKDFRGAIETYLQLVNISPNFAAAWLNLGASYSAIFDDKSAISAFEKAFALDPKNLNVLQNLWTSNQALGNKEKAYDFYIKLKELDPDRAQKISLTYGIPSLSKKDEPTQLDKFLTSVETYVKTNPQDIKRAKEQLNAAESLIKDDKVDQSIPILEEAYKIFDANLGAGSDEAFRANDDLILAYADGFNFSKAFSLIKVGSLRNSTKLWEDVYQSRQRKYGDSDQLTLRAGAIMGWILLQQSKFSEAKSTILKTYAESKISLGEANRTTLASRLLVCSLYLRTGFYKEASQEAKDIGDILLKNYGPDNSLYFASQRFLAEAYLGDKSFKEGLEQFKYVYELSLKSEGKNSRQTLSVMKELSVAYGLIGMLQEGLSLNEEAYESTKKVFGKNSREATESLSGLAALYAVTKQNDKAVTALEEVISSFTTIYGADHPNTVSYKSLLANTYATQRRVGESLSLLDSIIPIIENMRSSSDFSDEEKQVFFAKFANAYRLYAALTTYRNPSQSFNLSELSKARTLLESTAIKKATTSGVLDQLDQQKIQDFEIKISDLNERILNLKNKNDTKAQFELKKALLVKQYADFKDALKKRNPKFAQLSDVKIASAQDGRSLVPDDSIFVSYLTYGPGVIIYTIDSNSQLTTKYVPSIPALKEKIEIYRSLLASSYKTNNADEFSLKATNSNNNNTDPKTLTDISEYLGRFLIEPISSQLNSKKKIIISPDGPLAFIPFETLSVNGSLLVQDYDVSYVQSLSMLSLLKDRKTEYKKLQTRKEILAIGGATYSADTGAQRSRALPSEQSLNKASKILLSSRGSEGVQEAFDLLDAKWIDLPGTEKEVRSVASIFGEKESLVFVKSDASEQNLQNLNKNQDLRKFKRLLFSTHGYLSPNEPALSSIVLSQNNKSSKADGYLTASEIPAYDLKSDLVVLSACETGLGKIVLGEGVLGLPFSLYVAGNTDTIMTLWPIEDDSTAEFVKRLFKKLKSGSQESVALSQVKREFIAEKKYSQPVYWAPFVMYGY